LGLETQELYREVCTILFFRYGITPTANKLYQYVRKGSMSAPAEALAKFWEDLREKSRVRIEHPDLPEEIKLAAGELVGSLWSQAQSSANQSLATFRADIESALLEARSAKANAEKEHASVRSELERSQQATTDAVERAIQSERELAAERAIVAAQIIQIENGRCQQSSLELALAEARRDFSVELEKSRLALARSEERFEAAEKRTLLEVDRERSTTAKLQKEIQQIRQHHLDAEERHRTELANFRATLSDAYQKSGLAEGMLKELRTRFEHQAEVLRDLRTSVAECEAQKRVSAIELATCEEKLTRLELNLKQRVKDNAREGVPAQSRKRTSRKAT
jgi:pyruvate/2-oxoglutarate dehydrogenase complex dihydrolipoamide acyltransferase (E2) component